MAFEMQIKARETFQSFYLNSFESFQRSQIESLENTQSSAKA
jgi:hypothetical protein